MIVVSVDGGSALCRGLGGDHAVGPCHIDLALIGDIAPGQAILAHVGTAVRVLEMTEAQAIADAIEAVALASRGEPFDHLLADLIGREPELPPHLRARQAHQDALGDAHVAQSTSVS